MPTHQPKRSKKVLWIALGVAVTALTAVLVAIVAITNSGGSNSASDFNAWTPFGGIDSGISDGGRSVMLNTHDTTSTWSTKWSGIVYRGQTGCSVEIFGRVRDVSHHRATQGGFGIRLATTQGTGSSEDLHGVAIQFDYGFLGYRTARYPEDTSVSIDPAQLDSSDHAVRARFDGKGNYSMGVDGVTKVSTHGARVCGDPVIRVWAGATIFRHFSVRFLSD